MELVDTSATRAVDRNMSHFRYSTAKTMAADWMPNLDSSAAVRRRLGEITCQEDMGRRG
jgi:hypothetical protein